MKINFYVVFGAIIIVLLLFDPGTNANNISSFSGIKLVAFVVVCLISMFQMLSPFYIKKWSYCTHKIIYYFLLVVLFPTILIYFVSGVKQLMILLLP